jgi:hypothetical protein
MKSRGFETCFPEASAFFRAGFYSKGRTREKRLYLNVRSGAFPWLKFRWLSAVENLDVLDLF